MPRAYDNEAVVRRFYDEVWNSWRIEVADCLLAERLRFRGSLGTVCEGGAEFKRYVGTVRAAFPDWHNRVEEMVSAGDRVVARMTRLSMARGRPLSRTRSRCGCRPGPPSARSPG